MKECKSDGSFNYNKEKIFLLSLKKNNLTINELFKRGDNIIIDDVVWRVKSIELTTDQFNNQSDIIGVCVF
jgi:hypothetical protein